MKKAMNLAVSALIIATLSGCAGAAFNRLNLTVNRNITVGQELIDLQVAHEKGVISDTEYKDAKENLLNLVEQIGEIKK